MQQRLEHQSIESMVPGLVANRCERSLEHPINACSAKHSLVADPVAGARGVSGKANHEGVTDLPVADSLIDRVGDWIVEVGV